MPSPAKLDAVLRNQIADALESHSQRAKAAGHTYRPDRVLQLLIETAVNFAVVRGVAMKPQRPSPVYEGYDAMMAVRRFIERHYPSRFIPTSASAPGDLAGPGPVVGFCRPGPDGPTEFLFTTAAWRDVVCAGRDPKITAALLHERGLLSDDGHGRLARPCRVPGRSGSVRCYVVKAAIMSGIDLVTPSAPG